MPICWKACLEKKYSLAGWTAGILVYMAILGWYYPSLAEAGDEMQALMDLMPKDMWAMFGIDEAVDMLSPSGFLTAEAFGMMLPIFFSVFAMGIGSRAIGGEETDGTLELLDHPAYRPPATVLREIRGPRHTGYRPRYPALARRPLRLSQGRYGTQRWPGRWE